MKSLVILSFTLGVSLGLFVSGTGNIDNSEIRSGKLMMIKLDLPKADAQNLRGQCINFCILADGLYRINEVEVRDLDSAFGIIRELSAEHKYIGVLKESMLKVESNEVIVNLEDFCMSNNQNLFELIPLGILSGESELWYWRISKT